MWLLTTSRAELQYFPSPKDVPPPGFAILSHTWGDKEQTFQYLQHIHRECKESGDNPRDRVSEKIRRCCELAEADGYGWAWADMCCIDKTSSAELTEAINSMFRYYQLSGVCYVYLEDVHPLPLLGASSPTIIDQLKQCRWRTRGWTLQELIAPTFIVFLSSSWTPLGSKADLAKELSIATKIPEALLRLDRDVGDFGIAQRMSWAAERFTTREEDEAYCLLGIFDIHMPTLYGEGRNAFQRLQEEIMRIHPDTTLFAWGSTYIHSQGMSLQGIYDMRLSSPFAKAPRDFLFSGKVVYNHDSSPDDRPSFTMTSHGVRIRAPRANVRGSVLMNLFWHEEARSFPLFLRLTHHPNLHTQTLRSSTHRNPTFGHAETRYGVDQFFVLGRRIGMYTNHILRLVICDREVLREVEWQMAEFYLPVLADHNRSASDNLSQSSRSRIPFNRSLAAPFHVHAPEENVWYTLTSKSIVTASDDAGRGDVYPIVVQLLSPRADNSITELHILLGVCTQSGSVRGRPLETNLATRNTVHWARASPNAPRSPENLDSDVNYHSCSEDHITDWPDYTKTVIPKFPLRWKDRAGAWHEYGSLSLRFSRSPYNPNIMVLQDLPLRPSTQEDPARHAQTIRHMPVADWARPMSLWPPCRDLTPRDSDELKLALGPELKPAPEPKLKSAKPEFRLTPTPASTPSLSEYEQQPGVRPGK